MMEIMMKSLQMPCMIDKDGALLHTITISQSVSGIEYLCMTGQSNLSQESPLGLQPSK